MTEIAHPIPKFLTNTSEICLALITTFIASWLLGHGVSLTTSISFCLLFTCQCIIGAQIWSWLCNQQKRPMFESISVGYVIGSTLTTIADQVLINWGHRYLYLRIGIGVCTILIILNRGRHPNFKHISTNLYQNFSLLFFIFCFVVAGGHPLVKSWFFVFCICLFMGTLLAIRAKPIMEFSIIAISFMIIVSFGFVHYLWRPSLKYGPDLLFPLFSGTDDFIHSEATANSLIHFGPWNSIAAPGYRTAYHWFSLALSGNIKGILNAEPFVVTLHIAPLIGLLIISLLVVYVIYSISESITASIIALFIAFLTTTIPIGARTIQNLNTTNLISYFWSLSAVLTCLLFLKKTIRFGVFIITIFASLSFLSKTPHGVIVYMGIVGMLVVGLITKRLVHRIVLELMSSLTFSYICIYWFFLNPMPWQDRGFDYPLNSTKISVGSPFYPLVPIGGRCSFCAHEVSSFFFEFMEAI